MKTKPMHRKLWYSYFISTLIPLVFLALILTFDTSRRIRENNIQMNSNILSSLSYNIETLVNEMKQCSIQWVNNSDITDFYKTLNKNSGFIPAEPIRLEDNYLIASHNVLLNSGSQIQGIGFYPLNNQDHLYYIVKRYEDLQICRNYPAEEAGWFTSAQKIWGTAILTAPDSEPYYKEPEQYCFSVVRLAFDVDTRSAYGFVKVDASASYFDDLFSDLDFGEQSGLLLLNRDDDIIYSTNSQLDSYVAMDGSSIVSTSTKYTVSEERIQDTDWTLVILSSRIDLFRGTWIIVLTMLLVGLVTLLISSLLFSWSSRKFTEPMNAIVSAMRSAESGDLKRRIPVHEEMPTEFYCIATEYNQMLDKLNRLIDSEYKAKISQQRAEFAVLQTQINPHFLYNVLNNFLALNRIGYKQELEDSIIALTELFRYTSGKGHERTVAEELKFIERYLQLQHVRYRDRMEYTITLHPSAADYLIPKLILQPLVENCIVHGTEPVDRCVHISVSAAIECDAERSVLKEAGGKRWLCFTVTDDGAGVDMKEYAKKTDRTGIRNIQSRLALLSKDAVYLFESGPDSGSKTEIKIPVEDLERKNES